MEPPVTIHYFDLLSTGKRCRSDHIKGLKLDNPYCKRTIKTWYKAGLKVSSRFIQEDDSSDAPKIGLYKDSAGRRYLFLGLSVVEAAATIATWEGVREFSLIPHAFATMHRKLARRRNNGEAPITAEKVSSMFQTLNERAKSALEICTGRTGMAAGEGIDDLYVSTNAAIEDLDLKIKCSSRRLSSIVATELRTSKLKGVVSDTLHDVFCHLERVIDYIEVGPRGRLDGSTRSGKIWDAIESSTDKGSLFSYVKGLTVLSLLAPRDNAVDATEIAGLFSEKGGDSGEWIASDKLVSYLEDWRA